MKSEAEKGRDGLKPVAPVSHAARRAKVIKSLMIGAGQGLLARCKGIVPAWLERKGA